MKKKLEIVLNALIDAQNYVNGEMETICDVDAMDEAKECFVSLDDAIVCVRELLADKDDTPTPQNRVWVGYQVKTKEGVNVGPYTDKDVFRSLDDAEDFIRSQRNAVFVEPEKENLVITSRWLEGDEEKGFFTFHGKKNRVFHENEKVWDDESCEWVDVRITTYVCREDENVSLRCGNKKYIHSANSLYQIADDKVCPRCGGQLCKEHHDHIDYPYYCPECQENFYHIEV